MTDSKDERAISEVVHEISVVALDDILSLERLEQYQRAIGRAKWELRRIAAMTDTKYSDPAGGAT